MILPAPSSVAARESNACICSVGFRHHVVAGREPDHRCPSGLNFPACPGQVLVVVRHAGKPATATEQVTAAPALLLWVVGGLNRRPRCGGGRVKIDPMVNQAIDVSSAAVLRVVKGAVEARREAIVACGVGALVRAFPVKDQRDLAAPNPTIAVSVHGSRQYARQLPYHVRDERLKSKNKRLRPKPFEMSSSGCSNMGEHLPQHPSSSAVSVAACRQTSRARNRQPHPHTPIHPLGNGVGISHGSH